MHGLPPEISIAIVDGLDVTQPNDRKTLHSLLFVSKQVNVFALRTLYQDISFLNRSSYDQFLRQLCLFSRDIESNPGLRFTTAFSCRLVLRNRDGEAMIRFKEVIRTIDSIIPFLVNVRRMSISVDDGFAYPRALRSLPPSAPLTHLEIGKCGMCSEDFQQFLASRPTLECLSMYSLRSGSARAVERSRLTIDALPRLLSLRIDAEDMEFFENPLTSLVNLACDVRYISQMDSASIVRRMAPFASVTACRLSGAHFVDISPILAGLPHLEYLWVGQTALIQQSTNSSPLSATKLQYLRCCVYSEATEAFGRRMFDFVKTLVIVDVASLPLQSTIRMCHGNYLRPVPEEWTGWWEHAKRAVELAGPRPVRLSSIHG